MSVCSLSVEALSARHILTPLVVLSLKDVSPVCPHRLSSIQDVAHRNVPSRERRDSDDGRRDRYSA